MVTQEGKDRIWRGLYLLWIAAPAVCFLVLLIWLHASSVQNATFSTWTDSVVLAGNSSMSGNITSVNTSLAGLCTREGVGPPRLALPLVGFSLNTTRLSGTVFCTRTSKTYDSYELMQVVLLLSLIFQTVRLVRTVCWGVNESTAHVYHMIFLLPESSDVRLHGDCADFSRWLEYTVTSPLQIIVICGTVYMRNAPQLLLISSLQGALTLCGWTLEMLVCYLQITARGGRRMSAEFLGVLAKVVVVFAGAAYMHSVIWVVIFSAFHAHEANMGACDYGIQSLPPIIGNIVVVQCVCFSLFAVPLVLQTVAIVANPEFCADSMWDYASLTYDTLSIISKGLLALMFVKLITDNNCIDTYDGQACLH